MKGEKSVTKSMSALGALIALGIVFGDIGTSPLYVMKTILHVNYLPTADYLLGAISCIFWTLTLQTTVKYVYVALRADNHGEGGILALYALIKKQGCSWFYVLAIVGASTLIADGVITPAITVTSAIEGLRDISPHIPIVPLVLAIITVIFLIQRFGTSSIGRYFGPFMLAWFLMLGVLGGYRVLDFPQVIQAVNPYYAVKLLVNDPAWFLVLGAVFLCTTGAEALYSDLGHCGKKNITVSWLFVKLMLVLNYMGQGAFVMRHGLGTGADANPFFRMMPEWLLVPGIIMSTGAAIIASQALISGCFTIFSEAVHLDFWPLLLFKYPTTEKGQIYIPLINKLLYVLCVITILLFQSSAHMEAAYGLAITITMLMTTLMLSAYLSQRFTPRWLVAIFMAVYISIEGLFLFANMSKFMHGGWFTILLSLFFGVIMVIWYKARAIRRSYLRFKELKQYYGIIQDIKADVSIPKFASNLVYILQSDQEGMVEDKLIYSIVNKQPKRADHYWLIHFQHVDSPETLDYSCKELIDDTLFSIDIRIGFRVNPLMNLYLRQIIEDLTAEKRLDIRSGYPSLRRHGIAGDFRFIVIHRIYYPSNIVSMVDNLLLNLFAIVKHIGVGDERALGLDTSYVTVETVPLIVNTRYRQRITRRKSKTEF